MATKHRVRLRKGDHEIEIESADKNYLDTKLNEFLAGLPASKSKSTPQKSGSKGTKKANVKKEGSTESQLDVAGFVAHIKDSDNYSDLEKNIIDRKLQLPKIMMCMSFANEVKGDPYLTTGQIEAITNQLNIKIGMANAANAIKANQKYFTAKTVRKKGQAVPYKLNRQGQKAFEKYMNGEKP